MSRNVARISLVIFSLMWGVWSVLLFVGQTLGDCRDDHCFALRDAEIGAIGWRWLAIELGAVLTYMLNARFRKD